MEDINSRIKKNEEEKNNDDSEMFEDEEEEEEEEHDYLVNSKEYENYIDDYFGDLILYKKSSMNISIYSQKKKLIGLGNRLIVYKTKYKTINWIIASKITRFVYSPEKSIYMRLYNIFKRELNILSQISHPFIVKFIGYSPCDFHHRINPIIFLDYYKNGSLENILELEQKGKIIKEWNLTTKLINIFGIASAMSYLHSLDIIHQNLNPSSILLDDYLHPKLSGFCSAKFSTDKTISFNIGSYVAPEIWKDEECTKASDVYAFGMILYAIFNESFPFVNLTNPQIVVLVCYKNSRPKINERVPGAVKRLIESCWDEDPNHRPTFDQILNELENNHSFITDEIDEDLYRKFIEITKEAKKGVDIKIEQIKYFSEHQGESIHDQYQSSKKEEDKAFQKEALETFETMKIEYVDYNEFEKVNKESIGFGSFGDVFKVKHKRTGKIYAAKILSIIDTDNKQKTSTENFKKEIKILCQSKHPLIVKIFCHSKDKKSNPIIITEFVENGSLDKILKKEQIFREQYDSNIEIFNEMKQLIIIYGISSAMNYLHKNNILHLDIKPGNVLINKFFFPILCDFGLSEDKRNSSPGIRGTPAYISPELYKEEKPSEKSDVYSFAMFLYEITTKKIPFNGYNSYQIIYHAVNKNQRPKFDSTHPIPNAYKDLIKKCWDEDPEKRPTFEQIIRIIRENPDFITEKVDKNLFETFVNIINEEEKGIDQTEIKKKFQNPSIVEIYEKIKEKFEYELDYDIFKDSEEEEDNTEEIEKMHDDINSSIYKYEDKKTSKLYSVTLSNFSIDDISRQEVGNILKESRELSQINHPSIQKFNHIHFKKMESKRKLMIYNEYFPYRRLIDIISNPEKEPKWTPTKKFINIYGIAEGLLYLNSHQIPHQTPNPKNILVNENYEPKLSEIGFYTQLQNSKAATSMSSNHLDDFKFFYLSPEIIIDKNENNEKSDVYSFSIIAYQILTNELPFDKIPKHHEFIKKMFEGSIHPKIIQPIPKMYKDLLEKCFSFEQSERPSFIDIVSYLSKDQQFITDEIDKTELERYKDLFKQH